MLRLPQYGIHVANRDNRTNMSRSSALSYNRSPKIILSSVLTLESHILTNESQPFKHPQLPNQLAANLFNLTSPINNTLKCRPYYAAISGLCCLNQIKDGLEYDFQVPRQSTMSPYAYCSAVQTPSASIHSAHCTNCNKQTQKKSQA